MSFMGWLGKHPLEAILGIGGAAIGLPEILGAGAAAAGTGLTAAAGATAASPFALTAGAAAPGLSLGTATGALGGGAGTGALMGGAGLTASPSALSLGSLAPSTGGGLLGTMKEYKDVFGFAKDASGMIKPNSSTPPPQLPQSHGTGNELSQIVQADQQGLLAEQDAEKKRREQQMALIQGMGR